MGKHIHTHTHKQRFFILDAADIYSYFMVEIFLMLSDKWDACQY